MHKIVVVYKSKYGTTKRYAQWIAEELACAIFEQSKINPNDLSQYDTILYGGGLYAGGVSGIALLTKNFDAISDKNLILFTCGLADTADRENTDHIKQSLAKVLTSPMQEKIKVFHLRGGMDYSKLGMAHKAMMAMLRKMMLKKDVESLRSEDKEMLNTYGKIVDFTDKNAIVPIVEYVRGL